MRKIFFIIASGLALQVMVAATALGSSLLLTTGTPAGLTGSEVASDVWLAGQFTLSQAAIIDNIEGYIEMVDGDTITGALYSTDPTTGKPDKLINSFTVKLSGEGWFGYDGSLNWSLNPATYWISFQTTEQGVRAAMINDPPDSLGHRAYSQDQGEWWVIEDGLTIGYRVWGEYNPVPLPASAWLLGSGLLGLLGWHGGRRARKI